MKFWPEGGGKAKPGFILHHKNWLLKWFDPGRYDSWLEDDLVMMDNARHSAFHSRLQHSGVKDRMMALAEEAEQENVGHGWLDDFYERHMECFRLDQ